MFRPTRYLRNLALLAVVDMSGEFRSRVKAVPIKSGKNSESSRAPPWEPFSGRESRRGERFRANGCEPGLRSDAHERGAAMPPRLAGTYAAGAFEWYRGQTRSPARCLPRSIRNCTIEAGDGSDQLAQHVVVSVFFLLLARPGAIAVDDP